MIDCKITVKIKGKPDWFGTVGDAIKDWSIFYRAVFNHVKDCKKCNPDEVLQQYLELRQEYGSRTSVSLAALANRYARIGADKALVRQLIAKSGAVIKYAHLFTNEELYGAICDYTTWYLDAYPRRTWVYRSVARDAEKYLKKKDRPFLRAVSMVFRTEVTPPFEDLERLAVVAEVTAS